MMRRSAFLGLFAAFCGSAHALTIVPTFDTTITSDPNAAAIETGINNAITELDSYLANPVTVAVTFQTGGGLGTSSTYQGGFAYSTYFGALQNNQTLSAADNTAIASLPAGPNNPVNGNANVTLALPLFRALGFAVNPPPGQPDSTVTLNETIINNLRTGPQDPNKYDLQQVTMHELSEVLGSGGGGSQLSASAGSAVGPLDLYRYSASGVRSFSTAAGTTAYFSINGGGKNLGFYNQDKGGDYADWDDQLNAKPQVQDAFSTSGQKLDIDQNEITALDVVGWNLTAAGKAVEGVPEPSTWAMLLLGALGCVVASRRRVSRAK